MKESVLTPAHKSKKTKQTQALLLIFRSGTLPAVIFITQTYNCGREWLSRELLGLATPAVYRSVPWRTENVLGGGCRMAEQNCIRAITQWTCIQWKFRVKVRAECGQVFKLFCVCVCAPKRSRLLVLHTIVEQTFTSQCARWPSRFTRQTENLPAIGTWRVSISDPAHTHTHTHTHTCTALIHRAFCLLVNLVHLTGCLVIYLCCNQWVCVCVCVCVCVHSHVSRKATFWTICCTIQCDRGIICYHARMLLCYQG